MSKGSGKSSPHPIIEVRKWDNAGVLGYHLTPLAVRVAYAIANFANSKTGLAYPSLKTLLKIVQVNKATLRSALKEIKTIAVPLEPSGRHIGKRRPSGQAFAGPIKWTIVPFCQETAAAYLRMIPQRKRRTGRWSELLEDAHSEELEEFVSRGTNR